MPSAARLTKHQHIELAHASKHVGPVSIGTTGGGSVGVGVRDPRTDEERMQVLWLPAKISKPVVFRLDAKGQLEWEKSFERPEFDAYGGGLAIEAPDGDVLVMIPSYQRQTWGYVARILKLGRAGEVRWESSLPVNPATGRSPELEKMRLSDRGTLLLSGFVYQDADFRQLHTWEGEVDMNGKLVRGEVGGPRTVTK